SSSSSAPRPLRNCGLAASTTLVTVSISRGRSPVCTGCKSPKKTTRFASVRGPRAPSSRKKFHRPVAVFSTLERLPGKGDKPGGDRVLAHFRIYIALAVLGVIGCIGSPVVEAADATYSFDLPEQPLADALRAIGHEAAVNIIFAPEVVDGVRSPAIHGNLTVDQAVRQALAGKNLQIRQATPSSMVIERPSQDNSPPIAQEETQNQQELAEVVVTAQKRAERLQDVRSEERR